MKARFNCAGNIIVLCTPEDDEGDWTYDQIIYFTPIDSSLIEVKIFNNDGSLAGNCLNGLRALATFLYQEMQFNGELTFIQNKQQLAKSKMFGSDVEVQVEFPKLLQGTFDTIDLGNKHRVFWPPVENFPVAKYIPDVNEEYILSHEGTHFKVRVFECGVGETGSCGSGAVAVAFSVFKRLGFSKIVIEYPGGNLNVRVEQSHLYLSGPIHREE